MDDLAQHLFDTAVAMNQALVDEAKKPVQADIREIVSDWEWLFEDNETLKKHVEAIVWVAYRRGLHNAEKAIWALQEQMP